MKVRTKILSVTVIAVAVVVVLMGPAASWLQCRERQVVADAQVDALYLVCGAEEQDRRIAALLRCRGVHPDARILVGNDCGLTVWSREEQRNPTRAQRAIRCLRETIGAQKEARIAIVPGSFTNTDGEMRVLAGHLRVRRDISSVVMVSSPYHLRRCYRRFRAYAPCHCIGFVMGAQSKWSDRNPVVVCLELLKLVRDAVGLSQASYLSRT